MTFAIYLRFKNLFVIPPLPPPTSRMMCGIFQYLGYSLFIHNYDQKPYKQIVVIDEFMTTHGKSGKTRNLLI